MSGIKIMICEDNQDFLTYELQEMQKFLPTIALPVELHSCIDSSQLMKELTGKNVYDIYLLDIDMPDYDGITIGRTLRKYDKDAILIYVSGKDQYVFEAFEARPFSFIKKDDFHKVFQKTLAEAFHYLEEQKKILLLPSSTGINYRIKIKDIVYIECEQKHIIFHLSNGEQLRCIYKMQTLEESLHDYGFIRIHKGYLVNYNYIFYIEKDSVYLDTNGVLPLSKYRAADVKKRYLELSFKFDT